MHITGTTANHIIPTMKTMRSIRGCRYGILIALINHYASRTHRAPLTRGNSKCSKFFKSGLYFTGLTDINICSRRGLIQDIASIAARHLDPLIKTITAIRRCGNTYFGRTARIRSFRCLCSCTACSRSNSKFVELYKCRLDSTVTIYSHIGGRCTGILYGTISRLAPRCKNMGRIGNGLNLHLFASINRTRTRRRSGATSGSANGQRCTFYKVSLDSASSI